MIRALSRRFSARSYWRRFKEYKNTDSIDWAWMTTGQKLVHVMRSAGYLTVIAGGLGVIGLALNEVVKSTDESRLSYDFFADAKLKINENEIIKGIFGQPLIAYAQESSDTRIRNSLGHVVQKERDGDRLWMSFVLTGPKGKGYVTIEKFKKKDADEFEYVALIVNAPFANQSIAIIDNRPIISPKKIMNIAERVWKWIYSWSN